MGERPTGVTIVAALYLIEGVFGLLGALAIILLGGAVATMITGIPATGSNQAAAANVAAAGGFIGMIAGVLGIIMLVLAILALVVGWFLLKGKNWARWVAIIFAVLSLLGFPIGTIIGIVVIYFLLVDKAGKAYFEGAKA
ncbi:MAG: hypothetical protein NT067_00990 [Candidatus Diapherotrites archaeon]|nr:hypothetical protein [Candidatus Diapherotrites archaeon]